LEENRVLTEWNEYQTEVPRKELKAAVVQFQSGGFPDS
jgi:hypothetical protein